MKIKRLLFFAIALSIILASTILAQNYSSKEQQKQVNRYFYISVDFYSVGQGINTKALEELFEYINKIQKKHQALVFYERIYWGREGEETIYIDLKNLPEEERQKVLDNLYAMFRDRSKMAIVHLNLYFEPVRQQLVLGISLYGQIETRENALLNYIDNWEKHSRFKINPGSMINETAIPEDQDRRNELNLNGLEKNQVTEIVDEAQIIMQVRLPEILVVDFKGIGGANDRAYKGYLKAFISKFEKENKVTVGSDSRIYEMSNGGELFNIKLNNLSAKLKNLFITEVNKMFAEVDFISLAYY